MIKVLIIQTAFIGDVILATSMIETLHHKMGKAVQIDMLVRKGNEGLLSEHPLLNNILVWDKKKEKYKNLFRLAKQIRAANYAYVLNLQRYTSTGFLTWRSNAANKIGFNSNPFAFFFDIKITHKVEDGQHEIDRNAQLLSELLGEKVVQPIRPKLYPTGEQQTAVNKLTEGNKDYVVMAPASVWFTKQLPFEKWKILLNKVSKSNFVYLIGAPGDQQFIEKLIAESGASNCKNMAGLLDLLSSAVLIQGAKRSFVNDSAPLHLASAMNAPVTAFFCSTVPNFGFGPLSDEAMIKETEKELNCRPCGLHGFKKCPEGHFKCGTEINLEQIGL